MSGNKTRYLNFCQAHPVPLHGQPWWLDAVCHPDNWDVCLVENAAGEIVGSWPYYLKRRMGFPLLQQAPLTSYGGPYLRYPPHPNPRLPGRYDFEQKTVAALLHQLPPAALCQQNLYPELTNGLPFHWAGYQLHVRYTYRFAQPDKIWPEQMGRGTRRMIRLAEEDYVVEMTDRFEDVWPLYLAAYKRRNLQPVAESLLRQLDQAAASRQARHIFVARHRRSGDIQCVLYITRDHNSAYALVSGFQPHAPLNHANYVLYAHVLRFCAEQKLAFDFEGSMNAGVGHVCRIMGATRTPYLHIRKSSKWLELARVVLG